MGENCFVLWYYILAKIFEIVLFLFHQSRERNKTMNAIIDTDKLEAERAAIIRKEMIGNIVGGIILLATLALGFFLVTAGTDYHWC